VSNTSGIISLRIVHELLKEVDAAVINRNAYSSEAPITRNEWIVKTIKDKLAHLERSKRRKAKRKGEEAPVIGG